MKQCRTLKVKAVVVATVAGLILSVTACHHNGNDEKTILNLRKSKAKLLSTVITAEAIGNTNLLEMRVILDRQTNGFLAVPNSRNTFWINSDLAAWRQRLSNATDEIAIYCLFDSDKALGYTFRYEFIEFDPRDKGQAFFGKYVTK